MAQLIRIRLSIPMHHVLQAIHSKARNYEYKLRKVDKLELMQVIVLELHRRYASIRIIKFHHT
jgi:hypothetical protein